MTTEEMKANTNNVQNSKNAQNSQSAMMNPNNSATKFQDVANSDFDVRRKKEISIMKEIVYGKTPINILKTTSERNDATDITFTTLDGKVDTSKAVEKQRMTAESFIKTVMTIRNLSGQNVMIPEDKLQEMGLELAPYAKPFYDENNNKYYELSVTRRSREKNGKRLKFYANNKVSQNVVDKLESPSTNPKDGVDENVKSALEICEKMAAFTGVTLAPNNSSNVFMPSKLGKVSSKAKGLLSVLTLNRWKSKKFVPQSGRLYMNISEMSGTDIVTNYVSACAMRSFNTNIETFLNVVQNDRDFLSKDGKDKAAQINDYRKNYDLIKYKLHNICTDLIASEMSKMLPNKTAEERLAMSESYLTSAMQRMNELGKYLNDPYVMKFISTTVTNSVSRYNANFEFSANQIMEANCKVCGYKNIFKDGNRETAIFGEYEVPEAGDFKFSSFPNPDAKKEQTTLHNPDADKEQTTLHNPDAEKEQPTDTDMNTAHSDDSKTFKDFGKEIPESVQYFQNVMDRVTSKPRTVSSQELEDAINYYNESVDEITDPDKKVAESMQYFQNVADRTTSRPRTVSSEELEDSMNYYNKSADEFVNTDKRVAESVQYFQNVADRVTSKPRAVSSEELETSLNYFNGISDKIDSRPAKASEQEVADSVRFFNDLVNGGNESESDANKAQNVVAKEELPKDKENEVEEANNKKINVGKGIVKSKNGEIEKPASVDPQFTISKKTFGERTSDSVRKSISKYMAGLTAKALNEKSLSDKKRAVEKENASPISAERAQAVSASQNAVTTLYNNAHTGNTSKQAIEVIDKASRFGNNAEVIEAATLKELDKFTATEVDKVLKTYEDNKAKYPEWGACKTPASFMNYYYKNIVGAEAKYGNDLKKQVKTVCRKMDASVAADATLTHDGKKYRMYDSTTFIEKDEKSNTSGLNAYTIRKIVPQANADPKLETITVYSDNDDLLENTEYDEQFRDTFSDVEEMRTNNGYIGKGVRGMKKPLVIRQKADELRRVKMLQASKND